MGGVPFPLSAKQPFMTSPSSNGASDAVSGTMNVDAPFLVRAGCPALAQLPWWGRPQAHQPPCRKRLAWDFARSSLDLPESCTGGLSRASIDGGERFGR